MCDESLWNTCDSSSVMSRLVFFVAQFRFLISKLISIISEHPRKLSIYNSINARQRPFLLAQESKHNQENVCQHQAKSISLPHVSAAAGCEETGNGACAPQEPQVRMQTKIKSEVTINRRQGAPVSTQECSRRKHNNNYGPRTG